jgi:hypothetical protein
MKYRKKPVEVTAEIYRPGLEDGFKCLAGYNRFYCNISCDDCGSHIPYIVTPKGHRFVSEDCYIVTHNNGSKSVVSPQEFHEQYEVIE